MSKFGEKEIDNRVVCYERRKVYSSPEPAALDNEVYMDQVKAVCNRWIGDINGLHFDWYTEYLKGDDTVLIREKPPKIYSVDRPAPSHRERLGNISIRRHRRKVPTVLKLLAELLRREHTKEMSLFVSELLIKLKDMVGENQYPSNSQTSAFSRHLKTHRVVYSDILGMQYEDRYNINLRNRATFVTFHEPREYSLKDIYIYDDETSYTMNNRGIGNPVINLDTGKIYSSVGTAHRLTGIRKVLITWNCKGEIPYIMNKGIKYTFGFVKFRE